MQLDRKTAVDHLRKGWPVIVDGREIKRLADLPAPPAEGSDAAKAGAGRIVATRYPSGQFTHAGLAAIINRGEGVIHNGTVITSVAELPDEATLAQGDQKRLDAVEDELDRQQAQLNAQRERVQRERQRAGEQTDANVQSAPAPATPPPTTPTHGQKITTPPQQPEQKKGK